MNAPVETRSLIGRCLETLSVQIGPRPAASPGQSRAAEYIAGTLSAFGYAVEPQRTECPRWELQSLSLQLHGRPLPALANPFTPPCSLRAPLLCVQTPDELRAARLDGTITVLAGELTKAAFSPRNFDIFRDEAQDEIIRMLEEKRPLAVIAVSPLDAPVPLMEDADFPLPSVTVSRQVGETLLSAAGQAADLTIGSTRQAGYATNIVARKAGPADKRIVLCAHYDTKFYTPGAIDNASGVATLLALAGRLKPEKSLELVVFGGEDSWYPSEIGYIQQNESYLHEIAAVINIDGVGVRGRRDTLAFLECPEQTIAAVLRCTTEHPEIVPADPWYEGDHSLFWPRGIPSIAVTTEGGRDLLDRVVHTPLDTVDLVDVAQIERLVQFLAAAVKVL